MHTRRENLMRYWYWVLLRAIQSIGIWYCVLLRPQQKIGIGIGYCKRPHWKYWVLVLGSKKWYCSGLLWTMKNMVNHHWS